MSETARFQPYLSRWNLVPDGAPIRTHSSDLLPVSADGREAMLKVARVAEEKTGARLMAWWAGEGAARVMQHDENAILIERASGTRSLSALAREGQDDEATLALCGAVARLHQPRPAPPSGLVRLEDWFAPLVDRSHYAILARCAAAARLLLAEPTEILPLHGDVHHGNVLDFRDRGWLAIDPKGLIGERSFDYANLFRNPDLATATTPDRLARRGTTGRGQRLARSGPVAAMDHRLGRALGALVARRCRRGGGWRNARDRRAGDGDTRRGEALTSDAGRSKRQDGE